METDVAKVNAGADGHANRLNRTIEVLVINRVLVVVYSESWSCYLATYKEDSVVAGVRFELVYRRPSPGHDRWMFSHCRTRGRKAKRLGNSRHVVLTVRCIVIHVAL